MKVEDNAVVSIHYTLRTVKGHIIDKTTEEPISFIYGQDKMLLGLAKALSGRHQGESFTVTIPPCEAFGERKDDLQKRICKSEIDGFNVHQDITIGTELEVKSRQGEAIKARVVEVSKEAIKIDQNHPLAGMSLICEIDVIKVEASKCAHS